jgi:hypothetical protein
MTWGSRRVSLWSSPIILVRKKNGDIIFCMDYRKVSVIKKNAFPLPLIDCTLGMLAEAKLFSTLNWKSGYWQVGLHPDDKEKSMFSTGKGCGSSG